MRDRLIDLITVGIARYHVQKVNNESPDMAAIIADVLIENDYEKSTDVAEEIFAEMIELLSMRMGIKEVIAELKKKYIGKDTNVTTNTED